MKGSLRTGALIIVIAIASAAAPTPWAESLPASEYLLIERACQRLALLYSHYIDRGEASKAVALFTEDAIWRYGDKSFSGREAIAGFLGEREAMKNRLSRHMISNHLVNVVDGEYAEGILYVVHMQDNSGGDIPRPLKGQPLLVGQYQDEYVKTESGEWKIKSRRVSAQFVRD